MSKGILIGVLVLIGFGVGGFVMTSNSDDTETATTGAVANSEEASSEDVVQESEVVESEFDNLFGADLQSLTENIRVDLIGPDVVGFIEIGANDDLRVNVVSEGETAEFIQVDGSSYFKDPNSGQWFAYNLGLETVSAAFTRGIDPDVFEGYTTEGVTSNGEVSCDAGTCRSYTVAEDGESATLFIDTATNRVSEWSGTDSETGEPVKFTYSYDADFTIEAPENVQDFGL